MLAIEPLGGYLTDHLAGSAAARSLIGKAKTNNEGTPLGAFLGELLREVTADTRALEDVMDRLGIEKNQLKQTSAVLLERVSRLRFNDRLTGSSPLSRLMELEALCLGVQGKLAMWQTLRGLADRDERLTTSELDGLIGRAQDQLEKLGRHRLEASAHTFAG